MKTIYSDLRHPFQQLPSRPANGPNQHGVDVRGQNENLHQGSAAPATNGAKDRQCKVQCPVHVPESRQRAVHPLLGNFGRGHRNGLRKNTAGY